MVNSNAAWLSRRLSALGFRVARHVVLPDDLPAMVREFRSAFGRAELVVLTGGLGPTVDDLTRAAAARAAGRPLERLPRVLAAVRAFWERRGRTMPEANAVQADLPHGAAMVPNPVGTAPGFAFRARRALAVALPGVPGELEAMFDGTVEGMLRRAFPRLPSVAVRELHLIGLAEGEVDARLRGIAAPGGNPRLSLMVGAGVVTVRLVATGRTAAAARRTLAGVETEVRALFGTRVFGQDGEDIADVVVALLRRRGKTLAVAESCTGGLIGHLVTGVPGASDVFVEGRVTYADISKRRLLGVPAGVLARHGAVSRETAVAMARGARRRSGADVAVAVTGIAGPGGGSAAKPVGLVWIAVCDGRRVRSGELRLFGDRSAVKQRAARLALDLVRTTVAPRR